MKSILSSFAFFAAFLVLVLVSVNVQRLPEDLLNAVLGISIGLLLMILVILPWMRSLSRRSLFEASNT